MEGTGMAFTYELTGASGSFTAGGTTVNYTASAVGGALDNYSAGWGDIDGSNYYLGNQETPETYSFNFDQAISGFQINVNAQNTTEIIAFNINGVDVNLNSLIASGQVTVVTQGNGSVDGNGDLAGNDGNASAGNSTILQFNMPVDSLALTHGGTGNGSLVEILVSDQLAQDGIVEGTTGNDLINAAYAGDPDGDMVDNNDAILGVADEDVIIGGGNDTIYGGADDDSIEGDGTLPAGGVSADGNDAIFAEAGNDTVSGGGGADTIDGGTGNDSLSGDNGDDSISGGTGDDTLFGGNGSDTLNGDDGDDVINGESGDDIITVGVGDVADGGSAADTFNLDFAQTSTSASSTVTIDGGTSAGSGTDYDTLDLSGLGEFTLTETTDADGDSTSGTAVFDSGQTVSFSEIENLITCFTPGCLIQTDRGEVAVETLKVGDLVKTLDRGMQPIRWIGCRKLDAIDLTVAPKLRPIRISEGAMGNGLPKRDLELSPQHRVLMSSKIIKRMFKTDEVLIPVKKLVEIEGIDVVDCAIGTTYFHLLFDHHEIVYANGLPSESLYLGPQALKSISAEARNEVVALFPEILDRDFLQVEARPFLERGNTIKRMVMRHAKNHQSFAVERW
jgi:Ca2+-binding RTX toxin-like protein